MKLDIFRPEMLLVAYTAFVGLALLSFKLGLPNWTPSLLGFLIIFLSFPFYLLGIWAGNFLYGKKVPFYLHLLFIILIVPIYAIITKGMFFETIYVPFILSVTGLLIPHILLKYKGKIKPPNLQIVSMALGVVFLFATLYQFGGIPLLNPALKFGAVNNILWGMSMLCFFPGYFLMLPKIKSKRNLFLLIILSTLLFSLMAFRLVILILMLTGTMVAYYSKKLSWKQVIFPLFIALLIIVFLGYLATPILSPGTLLLHRAGTTHTVFDQVVQASYPLGLTQGSLFFQGNPRLFVSQLTGAHVSLTYTLLGAAVLEFGILGAAAWMFLLGLVLKLAHRSMEKPIFKGFYPFLFSMAFVWIELGPEQFQMLFFVVFILIYMALNSNRKS